MDYVDCRECKYSVRGYHDTICTKFKDPRSIEWMRDDRNECKMSAILFEPRVKKPLVKWIPY